MNQNRSEIFEETPGSGFWWARCGDHKGVLRALPAGEKAIALAVLKAWRLKERALRLPPEVRAAVFGK